MKVFGVCVAAAVLATGTAGRALAWGRTGHPLANGAAVGTLPAGTPLATFFAANKQFLMTHSSDPDLWRDKQRVPGEGPHHFIDLDAYGTPSLFALNTLPAAREDADKKFGHDFVEKTGTVDWTIDLWTHRLADAMKGDNPDTILADAAILGHYVADAHVPFHSAVNYDGQLSAQRGIHARFEEDVVKNTITMADLTPDPAENLPDVLAAARQWSGQSLDLTPTVLSADVEARAQVGGGPTTGSLPSETDAATGRTYTSKDGSPLPSYYKGNAAYWKTFEALCRPIALSRLDASATHLGSAWLTAWTLAGKPDLTRLRPPTASVPLPVPDPDAR